MTEWTEKREFLLGELIQALIDLDKDRIPFVSHNIDYVYVHFEDQDGEDIGNLPLGKALEALSQDVWIWPDSSTQCDDSGEPIADLDVREAETLKMQTH